MHETLIFKIIIFGNESLGKANFIQKTFPNLLNSDQKMTIGVDIYPKRVSVDGQIVQLHIWDLNGQPSFRFYISNYFKGAKGGLFLYDVTDRSSIACIDDWLNIIQKGLSEGVKIPILVVGIVTDGKSKRKVSAEEGLKISMSRNLSGYVECKLKTGQNVEKAFENLTRLMLSGTGYNPPLKAEDIKIFVDVSESTSDKVVRSENRKDSIDELLKKIFGAIPGVKSDWVPEIKTDVNVSAEGLSVASTLPQGADEARIGAMAAALLSLSERAIIEMEKGDFDQLYVEGSKGHFMITQDGPNVVFRVYNNADDRGDNYHNKHDDEGSEMSVGLVDV